MDARHLHDREAEGFELLAGARPGYPPRRDHLRGGVPAERYFRARARRGGREPQDRGRIFKIVDPDHRVPSRQGGEDLQIMRLEGGANSLNPGSDVAMYDDGPGRVETYR